MFPKEISCQEHSGSWNIPNRLVAMQRGSCFINFEDFTTRFNTYKKETKSSYSIQSSISVRYHNTKHGANVRPDITYVVVKLCCSQLQGHGRKRKSENICPAYFLLEYDELMDCLVVSDENSNHIHTEEYKKPPVNLEEAVTNCTDTPPKKLYSAKPSTDLSEDDHVACVPLQETPSLSQSDITIEEENISETPNCSTDSSSEIAFTDSPKEELVGMAVIRLAALINNFLLGDVGSSAVMYVGNREELVRLNFQTSKMSGLFLKFPESLLLHRVASKDNFVLYAFLVENKDRAGKVVHFSFLNEDNAENVSKMISAFQSFNPEWAKVKTIFTDMMFAHKDILKEAFPSAKLLLSMYHTVHLIQSKIKGKHTAKEYLIKLIDDVVYCTSPDKVFYLAQKLKPKLDKDIYDCLTTNWFSCELVWYMHVRKGLHSCSTYMHSLEQVTKKISSLFGNPSSLELSIQQFVEYADCFNSKGLDDMGDGSLNFSKPSTKPSSRSKKVNACSEKPTQCLNIPPNRFKPLACRPPPSQTAFLSTQSQSSCPNPSFNQNISSSQKVNEPSNVSANIESSLREHCNSMGLRLCLKEWEVVQKSTQLANVQESLIAVQLLEESHRVTADGRSCTCYFSSCYRLPCRHILSMLHASKKPVEENMVSYRWQKKYLEHRTLTEEEFQDTVLYFSSNTEEAVKRGNMIKNLTTELSNLLLQCVGSEAEVRFSTLQMIVDRWSKEKAPETEQCLVEKGGVPHPCQWVKKEPPEGEESLGCQELYRVDTQQIKVEKTTD
ncbi:zinc finger SWIM domain-containing protein 3 [Discoglossus pictus]